MSTAAGNGVNFVSSTQIDSAAHDAGISKSETDAIVDDYETAQLRSLKAGLLGAAFLALISLAFTARPPPRTTRPPKGRQIPQSRRTDPLVTYREFFSHVVDVVEAVGATILIVGGLGAFARYVREIVAPRGQDAFGDLRKNLGRVILLGLEVLIIADIIRTIVVDQSVESVVVLGTIVLIRIVLSFSLEVEIDGMWPWNRWRVPRDKPPTDKP